VGMKWLSPDLVSRQWIGNDGIITVQFFPNGTVALKHSQEVVILPPPNLWDRVRAWLGL